MGYIVTKQTKRQLITDIKASYPTVTEWSLVGNHLWCLYPADSDGNCYKKGDLLIHLFLIRGHGNGEISYQVYGEHVHPYHYTCPLKFLKRGILLNQEWRDNVLNYHATNTAKSNIKFNIGDIINLVGCKVTNVEVTSTTPLIGIDPATGIAYRIPKKFLEV